MNQLFDDRKNKLNYFKKSYRGKANQLTKVSIPEGMFVQCEKCKDLLLQEDLEANAFVCPKCEFHFRMNARTRINHLCSQFEEWFTDYQFQNPLSFPNYEEKIMSYQKEAKEQEAFVCGLGWMKNFSFALGVMDSYFMMGSMGTYVGEKVTLLIEEAIKRRLPLLLVCASGGARMQEGLFSLMQMAKTSAAMNKHHQAGLLSIVLLTDPTTGGVAASFASLGDILIAEKKALIGFAGQRVIQQTIQEELPDHFQTAEFQLEKGMVDMVVHRRDIPAILYQLFHHYRGLQQ